MRRGSPDHMACLQRANPTYHRDARGRTIAEQCRDSGIPQGWAYRAIQEGVPPDDAVVFAVERKIKLMIKKVTI